MKKRMEKSSKERGSSGVEEEHLKTAGLNTQDKLPVPTIDKYQCSGNLEVEFPELCALAGIREIPAVKQRTAESSFTEQANEGSQPQISSKSSMTTWSSKPCLQIEIENKDHRSIKRVRISGWRVDEAMTQVLGKVLPSLPDLQSLEMWQAGLTDCILTTLKSTVSLCANLRKVLLEGNPLPEQSYHVLIAENSMITHLSLRNNRIGEEGARLIGSALSTACSANKNLLSLNMAFNSIGDAGAIHIAQGLRFNRTLLHLSLASNHISDAGASCLAEVFGPFALTHEEIVERRRQLIKRNQQPVKEDSTCEQLPSIPSNSSLEHNSKGSKSNTKKKDAPKKDEKLPASQKVATLGKKEDPKLVKKTSDTKLPQTQVGKSEGKDKQPPATEQESGDVVETHGPLLVPGVQHADGKVIHPGNTTLKSLNLSGNKLTQKSLQMFLSVVKAQGEGLLRLSLNRNSFPADCDTFLEIQDVITLKDPQKKASPSA